MKQENGDDRTRFKCAHGLRYSRIWRALLCIVLSRSSVWAVPDGTELLRALTNGDAGLVRRLIGEGAAVNASDEFGSSALMYAALYADVTTLRLLLDRGANPNQADNAGATALMWAIPNEAKARLLVEHGANVNVQSKLTGRTPLLIAAGRPGAARVVRLLLSKGADVRARDNKGESVILRAAASGDAQIVRSLIDRGIDINAETPQKVTALLEANLLIDSPVAELLLRRGADINARDDEGYTVLLYATAFKNFAPFRALIARGADPSLRSVAGQDLLLAASASDTTHPDVIRELVKLGNDPKIRVPNLHTKHGFSKDAEGPLDWASRHGNTPVTKLLVELTGQQRVLSPPGEHPRLKASTARAAIEKALPQLLDSGREFFKRSGCTSCHQNGLPAIALSLARAKGIGVDEERRRRNYLQSMAWVRGTQETLLQDVRLPGADLTTSYLLWQLEADEHRRDRASDALVHVLAGSQGIDGAWRVRADRPPIESGRVTVTAIAIRALAGWPIPGRKTEFEARIRKAVSWLEDYSPLTGEEKAMRVLGLAWGRAESKVVQQAGSQLAAAQRGDGGWAQLDTLKSDAYATGQALYALSTAGQLSGEMLQKGVQFLLGTQLADGSWHVRSRSYPVQANYFDTGFPHGRDQWISAAGTSWACIGLSLAVKPSAAASPSLVEKG